MKKNNLRFCFSLILTGLIGSQTVFAAIKLPAIFTDGMVLQQRSNVAVWGWSAAGEVITITADWKSNKKVQTTADVSGKWQAMLSTPKAGGPYTITVKSTNTILVKDVLIGEVWLCSGQSNMVFSLKSADGAKEEIAKADFPAIRYFSVKRQYGSQEFEDCPGSVWEKTTPVSAPGFSAVAYYFAKKIHQQKNVPVGIIYAAWGGTPAEAWTPSDVIDGDSVLQQYVQRWSYIQANVGRDSAAYHTALNEWEQKIKAAGGDQLKKPSEPQTLYYFNRPWREPGVLFNGMVNPVIPFGIKGILWYQGESNVSYANEYAQLFSGLIDSWRKRWDEGGGIKDIPFYFVQIAPFGYSDLDAAARLRQAQDEVSKSVRNTAMAITIDLGNMKDIHFTRKKEVGDRLALIALHKLYGFNNLNRQAPVVHKYGRNGNGITIQFNQNIQTTNAEQPGGFEIGYRKADADSIIYVPSQAKMQNSKVIVWANGVQIPIAVRYAWLQIAAANLTGKDGLPIAPFSIQLKN